MRKQISKEIYDTCKHFVTLIPFSEQIIKLIPFFTFTFDFHSFGQSRLLNFSSPFLLKEIPLTSFLYKKMDAFLMTFTPFTFQKARARTVFNSSWISRSTSICPILFQLGLLIVVVPSYFKAKCDTKMWVDIYYKKYCRKHQNCIHHLLIPGSHVSTLCGISFVFEEEKKAATKKANKYNCRNVWHETRISITCSLCLLLIINCLLLIINDTCLLLMVLQPSPAPPQNRMYKIKWLFLVFAPMPVPKCRKSLKCKKEKKRGIFPIKVPCAK